MTNARSETPLSTPPAAEEPSGFCAAKTLHGIWRILPSPAITELLAQSGLDFQILDCEHGGYDYQTLLGDIVACDLHGCRPFVRVSGTNKVEVQRCLDLGARGIVFPQLSTYEDFRRAAETMDYAPEGSRGFNPFVRACGYGSPDKTRDASRPWFVPIVETLSAAKDLESILRIRRIDLVYIGTYDLSAQLGCAGKMDAPELTGLVNQIVATCQRHAKPVGMMAPTPPASQALRARGVQAIVHGVESDRFRLAMTDIVSRSLNERAKSQE